MGNLGVRELDEGGQELAAGSKAGGECEPAPGGPEEACEEAEELLLHSPDERELETCSPRQQRPEAGTTPTQCEPQP